MKPYWNGIIVKRKWNVGLSYFTTSSPCCNMSANRILIQRRCADLPQTTSDAGKCIEWQCWLAKLHTWFEYLCLKKLFKCVHFSFTICNVFLSGPWSQQHRGPYEGWAEQQNSQDAEPRGSGPWPRNGCPLHHLRGGRGLYSSKLTTASATCYPLRSEIDRHLCKLQMTSRYLRVGLIFKVSPKKMK